jgi:hypothetical protein
MSDPIYLRTVEETYEGIIETSLHYSLWDGMARDAAMDWKVSADGFSAYADTGGYYYSVALAHTEKPLDDPKRWVTDRNGEVGQLLRGPHGGPNDEYLQCMVEYVAYEGVLCIPRRYVMYPPLYTLTLCDENGNPTPPQK